MSKHKPPPGPAKDRGAASGETLLGRRALLPLLAAPALLSGQAWAQDAAGWPARTVTIIVPFAPGSSSDIVGRAMAGAMASSTGKPIVVENRPGATGELGARGVIRSAPDGYTLMHAPISTWAINVALRPNLGYDPVGQLTGIMQTVRTPNVLVVNPRQVPANDLKSLVAWLKENRASYSSSGIGSSDHLTAEMFKQVTGTDVAHVPYSGGAPATTDLIGGTVQMSFQNLGSILPQIQDGRVKPILITAESRSTLLPTVPTAAEAGLSDFVIYSWQAFGAPAGMAPALLAKIHASAAAALRSADVMRRMAEIGFEVVASKPEEFTAFQRQEIARWRQVVQAGNITPG
ncbi:tripartite tricarboxylate transporter substrate binding protein [Pseudoroseomonas wenyumeiae]|uniref:Tripartite tricarboxylate transporter substrate binding protein n=1 Tax=Teichococcus wenyumeiae TaxID=2478470 RepID=A0A3A9J6P5_9PROT|nr:tripartite tricarboxylate transporter substrate binding protein [Pseudoroseomonas wenyumeiae]RKK02122.1 tripartite tricarboxylate transporter substrate binding protein [Pseudoroseomonas wenyumeiae]RMI15489.1 tripartite tricarboxylate transporter substrate binding protein [Pseudoroseomonas wenyumeiae]